MTYQIKKLEKTDLKEHLWSLIATFENLSAIGDMNLKQAENIFDEMQKKGSIVFIALDPENGIIWSITLLIEQKFQRWWASCGHLEDVVVRKWFQWQWIGTALMKTIMQEVEKYNCYKIILDCERLSIYEEIFDKIVFTSYFELFKIIYL